MENITVKNLNLYSYLEYENKTFIALLIFGSAFFIYLFPEHLLYAIIFLVVLTAIRYFILNKTYTTYSIIGKDKDYFLVSKTLGSKYNTSNSQYSDISITGKNYLEEFLFDFCYKCDWDNSNEVDSYKQILSNLKYAHIPDSSNNQFTLPKMNEKVNSKYTSLMKNLDNNEKVKLNVGKLHKTLSSIYSKRSTYNMEKSISNLENLL